MPQSSMYWTTITSSLYYSHLLYSDQVSPMNVSLKWLYISLGCLLAHTGFSLAQIVVWSFSRLKTSRNLHPHGLVFWQIRLNKGISDVERCERAQPQRGTQVP